MASALPSAAFDRLCLSEIKSEHVDGAIRRKLANGEYHDLALASRAPFGELGESLTAVLERRDFPVIASKRRMITSM